MSPYCPNCGVSWSLDEIEWEQCDCCGFTDIDDDENDWDFDNYDEDDFDGKCEDKNSNDSRNV